MFYFFFESRGKKEDPVVIWLTGGPGCSSELAVFYENGPFTIANNMSLVWNKFGWDKVQIHILSYATLIQMLYAFREERRNQSARLLCTLPTENTRLSFSEILT
jgi:hypothetical protein